MKQLLLVLLLIITVNFSYSQLSYSAGNAVNIAGTYTDLGTNGTVIATPGFDDDNSEAQNIGFNFSYNGTTFTQFILNTNGVIKLGATVPADPALYAALGTTETNLIYPLNLDLDGGTSPEYRVFTNGTAPDRVCTIQFKNVKDFFTIPATAPQFSDMDFQIKLYETSNNIEFVYGTFVAGAAASAATFTEVGIKGNNASSSINVTKASASAWASATFINGDYDYTSTILHNISNTVLPVAGTTYRLVSTTSLPIKLLSFSGRIQNNTVFLTWLTSYESNHERFVVEKSPAGYGNWSKIGTVNAFGNSATANKYQFTEAGLTSGKWMYRLKIFDADGKFNYSPVVILRLTGKALFLLEQNYPNPVHDITMIHYELGKDAIVRFELFSMDGKKIMAQQKGKQTKGSYNFPIDVESLALANGKYVYSIVVQDIATGQISTIKKDMIVFR